MYKFLNLAIFLGAVGSAATAAVQTQAVPQGYQNPSQYQGQSNQNQMPQQYQGQPYQNQNQRPSQYQGQPNQNQTPSQYQGQPNQNQMPSQYQVQPTQNQRVTYQVQPSQNGSMYEAAPVQNQAQMQPNQNQRNQPQVQPPAQPVQPTQPNQPNQPTYLPNLSPDQIKQLKLSSEAAQTWLNGLDSGQFGSDWDNSSTIFQSTLPKAQWVSMMDQLRKPMGRMISRDMIDQRIAADPKGLPAGDYMVLIYNTTFSNKPSAIELVTLRLENGQWKVLTYQVK